MTAAAERDAAALLRGSFGTFAEAIPQIVWTAAADGRISYLNQRGLAYQFGEIGARRQSPADPPGLALHPDDVGSWTHTYATSAASGVFELDCRLRRHDGAYRWHRLHAIPIHDTDETIRYWIGTAIDVDAAKQAEVDLLAAQEAQAESLALLEMLESKAPIGLGYVDRDLRRIRVNETLARFTGVPVADEIGRPMAEITPTMWPFVERHYRQVLRTGRPVLDVVTSDPAEPDPAKAQYWLNSYYPIGSEDEVHGVGVVTVDVSELKHTEQAHRQLANIIENSGEAIFSMTLDAVATSWNPAAERLFGYRADEMIGQPLTVLAPPELRRDQDGVLARIRAGGPAERYETTRLRKDGSRLDVMITSSPTVDEAGHVVGLSVIVQNITDRLAVQRELAASQRRLSEAQQIARMGSFEINARTGERIWSDELCRLIGIEPGSQPGTRIYQLAHPDDLERVHRVRDAALEQGIPYDHVHRLIRADGQVRWVRSRAVPETDESGRVIRLAGTMADITDQIEAERERRDAEARFEIAFEQSGIGAGILGLDGIPLRVNEAAGKILGRSKEQLVNRPWDDFQHPEERPAAPTERTQRFADTDTFTHERRFLRPDGTVIWAQVHIATVCDDAGAPQYYFAQMQDITERKVAEAELAHQALHDSLTGLSNRTLLADRLDHALAATRRRDSQLGLIFLDLDHFKLVNDSMGHGAGDDLLKHVANRISGAIRESDTVARFGGDEFVIVCDDASVIETEHVAGRVLQAVSQPYLIAGEEISVTASLGIAMADQQATAESLLRDCDSAMYLAKRHGRGRVEMFDPVLRSDAEQRMATASALGRALKCDEFTIHYQPVIDVATGRMVSAEALLRWDHPERGLVGPAEFIPVAEDTGMITQIGAWVLEQACTQLAEWQIHDPQLSIAVNLSVRQILACDLVGCVEEILTATGVPPQTVHLEVTESIFMGDIDLVEKTLTSLKALGVRLSIDDFGTGYSSLSYLKRFPVDAVKIDRAFIDGLGTDPHDSALVAAILAMAEALGLSVTAEGIETPEQLAILKQLRCPRVQGFHLARPMVVDALTDLVRSGWCWPVG